MSGASAAALLVPASASDSVVSHALVKAKQRYGVPRLAEKLREQGPAYNGKTIATSLRRHRLVNVIADKGQLACDALQMAFWRRTRLENVIVHIDLGGQY